MVTLIVIIVVEFIVEIVVAVPEIVVVTIILGFNLLLCLTTDFSVTLVLGSCICDAVSPTICIVFYISSQEEVKEFLSSKCLYSRFL